MHSYICSYIYIFYIADNNDENGAVNIDQVDELVRRAESNQGTSPDAVSFLNTMRKYRENKDRYDGVTYDETIYECVERLWEIHYDEKQALNEVKKIKKKK